MSGCWAHVQYVSTYRTDADLLRDLLLLVNVDLIELQVGELVGQLLENWRDDLAGAAPSRPEVKNGDLFAVDLGGARDEGERGMIGGKLRRRAQIRG